MDSAPWPHQEIVVVKPMDEIIVANTTYHQKPPSSSASSVLERKVRTQKNQQALNCPRCHSTSTKFCYYNNYSLSQPRYICKTCRRYWTEGGSLRNIPVGGSSRKNKRHNNNSSSSANSPAVSGTSSCKKILTAGGLLLPPPPAPITQQNPNGKIHESSHHQDLNLGFFTSYSTDDDDHSFKSLTEMIQVPYFERSNKNILKSSSALELLTGFTGSRDLENCGYMPMIMTETTGSWAITDHLHHHSLSTVYSTGRFPLSAEFMKQPSDLNFSLDGLGSNYGSFQGVQENTDGKLLFPFEDLKTHQVSSNNANDADQQENRTGNGNDSNGFFGMD